MAVPDRLKDHRVVPRGKQRLPNALIEDLAAEWETHGPACLRLMRSRDNTRFVQLAYSTLPKDILISVEHRALPGNLDPDDWALMRQVLELIKANVPTDSNAGPAEVFQVIEEALRARYAKQIGD
jgi:hypothetical protein